MNVAELYGGRTKVVKAVVFSVLKILHNVDFVQKSLFANKS